MIHSTTGARCATVFAVASLVGACAQTAPAPEAAAAATLGSGVLLANMDTAVRPQDDFYRFVNGTWLKTDQIPADKSNYGAFNKLADESEKAQRAIIEELAARTDNKPGTDEQKVGDLYTSFMNEARVEELGATPLKDEMARIRAADDKKKLPAVMAHLDAIGVTTPIGLTVDQDAKEPTVYRTHLSQSGLGLPDRDYYLSDDPKMKETREKYLAHVEKMLTLSGDRNAANNARAIFKLETRLAQKQWARVDSRDHEKTYNKFDRAGLKKLAPNFGWDEYFEAAGYKAADSVIVAQPGAFSGFSEVFARDSLPAWRAYLRWHLLSDYAPFLSKPFVDENFAFYGKVLGGIQELRPRWKRGVAAVHGGLDGDGTPFASKGLGEALGRLYVAKYVPPQAKARMEELVKNLLQAYHDSISSLEWMSPETRQKALDKLAKFTTKIGYPEHWRDYSSLAIKPDDLVGNLMRAAKLDHDVTLAHLGQPVDRSEWHMMPQVVNAYYNSKLNEIVFPAAILRPPFFNLEADDAVNYGGIGAVIGHEIGHGFDDQGSKSDGDGRLQSWWTEADRKAFEAKTRQLIAQYDAYEPLPGQHVQGALTIGENIGDLGGASIAFQAWQLSLKGKPARVIDGFTGEQRFFIGYAQIWLRKFREQALLERIKSDSHSPSEYRCNGIAPHVPEFYAAFDVKPGDRMYMAPEQRVKIW